MRGIYFKSCLAIFGFFMSMTAKADGGIAGVFQNIGEQVKSSKDPVLWIFMFLGLCTAGHGLLLWKKKNDEGESSRITMGRVGTEVLIGAFLTAVTIIIKLAGETTGVATGLEGL